MKRICVSICLIACFSLTAVMFAQSPLATTQQPAGDGTKDGSKGQNQPSFVMSKTLLELNRKLIALEQANGGKTVGELIVDPVLYSSGPTVTAVNMQTAPAPANWERTQGKKLNDNCQFVSFKRTNYDGLGENLHSTNHVVYVFQGKTPAAVMKAATDQATQMRKDSPQSYRVAQKASPNGTVLVLIQGTIQNDDNMDILIGRGEVAQSLQSMISWAYPASGGQFQFRLQQQKIAP